MIEALRAIGLKRAGDLENIRDSLLLQVDGWEPAIRQSLSSHQLMIPILVALAAVGGFVLQEGRSRQESAEE